MESKKTFASFAEDSPSPSGGPSSFLVRPLSPQRTGRLGRRKSSQAAASISGHEGLPILSCVTRETSQEDCARHRFIVWAAVKRNSCSAISAPEKLECPLLRCRRRFPDHETMLRHLAGCEHLPSGEYWCHEHMRIERFDDVKCKRCLGHPSKRRKMLSMAKSFFQSLGHKPRKGPSFECDEDSDCLPPPPSYESLEIGPCGMGAELSATEIVEIDSTEVGISNITEENIPDPGIDPQALLIPELDSTAVSYESFIQWPAPTAPNMQNDLTPAGHEECRSPLGKPALQVTTHGLDQYRKAPRPAPRQIQSAPRSKGLSPSSSVRSTTSTTSTTSNVSSLVSPVSTWSGAWSLASGAHTNMTTPIDLVSPSAFLSEHPFGRETDCQEGYMDGICSELPADYPTAGPPLDMAADALFCSFDAAAPTDMTYASNIVLTDDLGAPLDLPGPELHDSNICCSETKAMVGSAWDTLQEHLASSVRKTQYLDNNPLAEYLRSLSTKSIALIGLRALKGVLDGHLPTSPRETLCFIHLIYAFSLVVHESEAAARSVQLFLQALAYRGNFPREDQQPYTRIVLEIWQPLGIPQDEIDRLVSLPAPPFPRQNGKQPELQARKSDFRRTDAMLSAARDFLDELESSLVFGEAQSTIEVLTSDLYSKHFQDFSLAAGNTPFTVTVSFVVTVLIQDFSDVEGLIGRLNGVHQRVNSGIISSVRRAELELLQSAKGCMAPSAYFDRFAPTVRKLCDPIYQQHESGTLGRDSYCALGISLVESIFTQFDTPSVQISLPTGDKDETLDGFFGDLTPALAPDAMEQFVDAECLLDLPIDEIHMEMKASTEPIPCPNTYFGTPVIPQTTSAEPETGLGGQQEVDLAQQSSKVESDACCEICGYRPKGDPQWFKGSMAKHKKLQHSAAPPKIYRCPYPGCVSAYKNRPDNLRQHQIEKGHFVGEEAGRRPSKRKKLAED